MRPILFSLGPLHLYSFGVMVALGIMVSLQMMFRRARRTGFASSNDVMDLVFVTVAAGFAGGRLFYVIQNASWYLEHPLRIFAIWEGGLIFYGGVFGALAGLFVILKIKKIAYLKGLDFLLPYTALAHAFGRIGCFLNGCCYGSVCRLPWAVQFPGLAEPVHPAQLYESVYDFCLFLFLNARYEKKHFEGEITALYFMLYAAGRFLMEFLRSDNPSLGFLTWNQWWSVLIFAAAALLYRRQTRPLG